MKNRWNIFLFIFIIFFVGILAYFILQKDFYSKPSLNSEPSLIKQSFVECPSPSTLMTVCASNSVCVNEDASYCGDPVFIVPAEIILSFEWCKSKGCAGIKSLGSAELCKVAGDNLATPSDCPSECTSTGVAFSTGIGPFYTQNFCCSAFKKRGCVKAF